MLVFGKTGQVAQELAIARPDAVFLGRDAADLSDPAACATAIETHQPSAVINAAAYTAVDKAEEEEPLATIINGAAPGAMAKVCAAHGIPFVHISTDYVFDGSGEVPWKPDDATAPLGAYGRSKRAGEAAVMAAGGAYGILRTSWVFSAHGGNFVKTMLRLSETRDRLTIVADQVGGPTPAAGIAAACLRMAEGLTLDASKAGVYHYAGAPAVSWAAFARAIFAKAGRAVEVVDIPASDFPTPAKRPGNSRMDGASLAAAFGLPQADWDAALDDVLNALAP